MIKQVMFLRVVAAGAAFAVSVGTALAGTDSRVIGVVTDASTGMPVAGVSIVGRDGSGGEIHASTDAKGRFSALGLSNGTVSLAVAHPGYASEQVTCRVPSGEAVSFDIHVAKKTSNAQAQSKCRLEPNTQDRYIIE